MNYLLLICGDHEPSDPAAEPPMAIEEWVRLNDERGRRIAGRALDGPGTAVAVRTRDGETLLSDGPFAEAKEFIAGFDVIEAADLDEALQVAATHPMATFAATELRPFSDGLVIDDALRDWGAHEPPDSWALFFCIDGIPESAEVEARVAREAAEWGARQRERGTFVFGHPLRHADAATTVRVRGGETLLSDGPFAESKEFIAGIVVLCGVTRAQAIAAAAEHPVAAFHRVEVRRFADGQGSDA